MSEHEVLAVPSADRPTPPNGQSSERSVQDLTSRAHGRPFRFPLTLVISGLAGALVGARTLAKTALPHILLPPPSLDYQNAVDGQPVSRLLDWNQAQIDGLLTLRELSGAALAGAAGALYLLLFVLAVRLLNPSFRLFRVVAAGAPATDPAHAQAQTDAPTPAAPTALNAAIKPDGLIKALQILALLGTPVAVCWLLTARWDTPTIGTLFATDAPGRWGWIWAIRMPALFAAFWVGFAPDGLAGEAGQIRLNVAPATWPRLAAIGAGVGLGAMLVGHFAVPGALEPTLLRSQALGAFNRNHLALIGGRYLVCMAAAWAAVAALVGAACGTRRATWRIKFGVVVVCLGVALYARVPLDRRWEEAHLDLTAPVLNTIVAPYNPERSGSGVPDGPDAAALLAAKLGVKPGVVSDPARPLLVFRDDSDVRAGRIGTQNVTIALQQNAYTTDALPYSPTMERRAVEFLQQRRYQSGLAWSATKYRYESAAQRFDITSMLTACLDDLTYGPHPFSRDPLHRRFHMPGLQIADTAQTIFCICAATPQNHALLDRWADLKQFAFPDRQSKRLIGDIYRRFGDVTTALAWYRRAEMPRTFLARIAAEQPLFHAGHIAGTLRLNGKPLAGVQVGVVPERMNGLPHGLEGLVNGAIYEIMAQRPGWPGFGPFHPLPHTFRWLSAAATTNARGEFAIDGLTEGEYTLLCTLPATVQVQSPLDPRLRVSNPPLPFNVHYGNPNVDLGIIELNAR